MEGGLFRFSEPEGQVGGVLDPRGTYHIGDGHQRVVAALELEAESGDDRYVWELLTWRRWDEAPVPRASRPMPARSWWKWFRNRIGY